MSRFSNLEFDGDAREETRAASSTRDESFHLAAAEQAFHLGRFEQALRGYSKALEFNPRSAAAWSGQARMLIELGEFEEANIWSEKALQSLPDEPDLLAAKGVALARLGDLAGAISYCDAAIEAPGGTPYIWLARADVLLARQEKRADYCFDKAFALAAHHWVTLWLAARIQSFHQRFARALTLARQALELEPGRAVLWLEVARCQLALGLVHPGRHSLAQARELDPECDATRVEAEAASRGILDKLAGRWRQWWRK